MNAGNVVKVRLSKSGRVTLVSVSKSGSLEKWKSQKVGEGKFGKGKYGKGNSGKAMRDGKGKGTVCGKAPPHPRDRTERAVQALRSSLCLYTFTGSHLETLSESQRGKDGIDD